MINQLLKMLKFEYRLNNIIWLYNVLIAVIIITALIYLASSSPFQFETIKLIFSLTAFITCIFIINSYQESTTKNAMQMYHQIPISGNVKFISKQIITLIGFPLTVMAFSLLALFLVRLIIPLPTSVNHVSSFSFNFIPFFIFGIGLSTFLAILFKKNKILYSFVVLAILKFVFGTAFALIMIIHNGSHPRDVFGTNVQNALTIIVTLVALILYAFSYRQFFRRQL